MRPWFLILLAITLGIGLGTGLTMIELGAAPAGAVAADLDFAAGRTVDPAGPRVSLDEERFDFGTMMRDETMEHRFTVRNVGLRPLVLTKGQSSCRCTEFTIAESTLPPGGQTKVLLEWKANVGDGPFRQTAEIETNDPSRPVVTLTIEGKVLRSHWAAPSELVFSNTSAGDSHTADLRVYAQNQGDLQVIEHKFVSPSTADKFEIRTRPLSAEELAAEPEAKGGLLVRVTVKPGLPLGPVQQLLHLQLNLPEEPVVEVPLHANVISDVQIAGRGWDADRGLIDFGSVSSREGAKANLFLQARGPHRHQFRPRLREVDADTLKVSLGEPTDLADGNLVRVPLTVEIPPGTRPAVHLGNQQGKLVTILIDTGHPEAQQVRVLVRYAVSD